MRAERDRAALLALPEQPYLVTDRHLRRVGRDCLISFEVSRYSVPARKIRAGQRVELRVDADLVAIHALLTGRGRAYVVGDIANFDAALVAPDYCRDEPQAWGEPNAIWRILSELDGWTAVEVPCEVAPPLAKRVAEGRGRKIEAVRFSEMQVPAPRLADRQTLPGYARARRTAPPRRAENRGGDAHGTVENR